MTARLQFAVTPAVEPARKRPNVSVDGHQLRLVRALVGFADTLVSDYDVVDLAQSLVQTCVDLLGVDAAGLMLSDQHGELAVLASSDAQTRALELFQLQSHQGPCLECFKTGQPISVADLATQRQRWPQFTPTAHEHGYAAGDALPLRLRDEVIGALNLFRTTPGQLAELDRQVAQALADTATIGILHERAIQYHGTVVEQLQTALNSRIVIEQAKGILAERGRLSTTEAFTRLRAHARTHHIRLSDLAAAVATRDLDPDIILTGTRKRPPAAPRLPSHPSQRPPTLAVVPAPHPPQH